MPAGRQGKNIVPLTILTAFGRHAVVNARDLAMTVEGRIDRGAIPTRKTVNGELVLPDKPRPAHYGDWALEHPPE